MPIEIRLPPEPDNPEPYMRAFRDIVWELLHRARQRTDRDDAGYRSALFGVLGHIKNQAETFELDLKYLGLADFDPEAWFVNAEKN